MDMGAESQSRGWKGPAFFQASHLQENGVDGRVGVGGDKDPLPGSCQGGDESHNSAADEEEGGRGGGWKGGTNARGAGDGAQGCAKQPPSETPPCLPALAAAGRPLDEGVVARGQRLTHRTQLQSEKSRGAKQKQGRRKPSLAKCIIGHTRSIMLPHA